MKNAKLPRNDYLQLADQYLTDELNCVGSELLEKLLADNPSIDVSAEDLESSRFIQGIAALPKISKIFAMFEPMTVPTAVFI